MTVTRICDKCKRPISSGGFIHLQTDPRGGKYTSVLKYKYDICPDCETRLFAWFEEGVRDEEAVEKTE